MFGCIRMKRSLRAPADFAFLLAALLMAVEISGYCVRVAFGSSIIFLNEQQWIKIIASCRIELSLLRRSWACSAFLRQFERRTWGCSYEPDRELLLQGPKSS